MKEINNKELEIKIASLENEKKELNEIIEILRTSKERLHEKYCDLKDSYKELEVERDELSLENDDLRIRLGDE